jgi:hypothetical protein
VRLEKIESEKDLAAVVGESAWCVAHIAAQVVWELDEHHQTIGRKECDQFGERAAEKGRREGDDGAPACPPG